MIVLDTNVVSELARASPDQAVQRWIRDLPLDQLFCTTVNEAELLFGIERLPHGRRRADLLAATERLFAHLLVDRVLPFDRAAARQFAELAALQQAHGRTMQTADALIAATARAHGATLIATRDLTGFEGCGVRLVDPWAA